MSASSETRPRIELRQIFGTRERALIALSRVVAVSLLVIGLSLVSPHFLSIDNIINVLRQSVPLFILSAGLTLVVLTAGIDLSVGAVLGLAACIAGSFIAGGNTAVGIVLALSAGLACGLINGVLVAYARIPSFIATYGMLWIANGMAYVFMKGEVIYGLPTSYRFIATGKILGVPTPIAIGTAVLLLLYVVMKRTAFGRAVYAIGGNPLAARLSGMPVQPYLVLVYTLSGLLSACAALIIIARTNAADVSLGEEQLLPAIAAVCLGGTSLFGGVGGIVGTAIGAIILSLVLNGMNLLGIMTFWQAGVLGAIILLSVFVDQMAERRTNKS